MGPTTRTGKELQLQPTPSEIVVNSLLYFVQNAMIGDCHSDPKVSKAEIDRNIEWICDEICYYYESDKRDGDEEFEIEEAFELLFDVSKPWFSPEMKQIRKIAFKSMIFNDQIKNIIRGVGFATKNRKCSARFATVNRRYPLFEDTCTRPTEDQMTLTEPFMEPANEALPEDRPITGKDFNVILDEIRLIKAQLISSGSQRRKKSSSVPKPKPETELITETVPVSIQKAGSSKETSTTAVGEELWTQVVKKKRRPQPKATIGSCESTLLPATNIRPVNLFLSRLAPSTTDADVRKYLEAKAFRPSKVQKLESKFDFYSSFHVVMDAGNMTIGEVLQPANWPMNILVRRYYVGPRTLSKSTLNLP